MSCVSTEELGRLLNTSPVTAGGKTFIPKVHPEKNFALLSQIPQGTEVTHVPPEREKKKLKAILGRSPSWQHTELYENSAR